MGVFCDINLHKAPDGNFSPGSSIFGVIKYAIDEDTLFSNIKISFKGRGRLVVEKYITRTNIEVHKNKENYFEMTDVIHDDVNGQKPLPRGSYEAHFNFKLPEQLPSTLHFLKSGFDYDIKCYINYFLSIKFKRPGFFEFDKKFKKEIIVQSGINPMLPTEPTIFTEVKRLKRFLSNQNNVIHIKAKAQSCIIKPGKKIEFDYEVTNNSNVNINEVKIKLKEVYTFSSKKNKKFDQVNNIKGTDIIHGSIKPGEILAKSETIEVPSNIFSLDGSQIAKRDYFVTIKTKLPFPYSEAVLKIPLQIGEMNIDEEALGNENDAPPSYWEVMAEYSKSQDDLKS